MREGRETVASVIVRVTSAAGFNRQVDILSAVIIRDYTCMNSLPSCTAPRTRHDLLNGPSHCCVIDRRSD